MNRSALVGDPPANQDDFYIIRGFYLGYGLPEMNPKNGIPPLKAPPGAPHGQNRGPGIIASYSVLIFLIVTITSARLALRYFKKTLKWGPDDYAIILGASAACTWVAITIAQVLVGGSGRHIYDITYEEFNWFIDLAAADTMIFYVAVGLIKISIALFNRRLTGLTSRKWMIFHNIMLGLLVSFIISAVLLEVFKCHPVLRSWDLRGYGIMDQPVSCIPVTKYGLALNIIHVILDFALLSVPVIVFCKMKMNMSKRIRLIFLFSIGCMSVVGSVNRQIIMVKNSMDLTYMSAQAQVWTITDLFFGCIAASLPVLNALIPKKWRSGVPNIEKPNEVSKTRHRFAPETTNSRQPHLYGDMYADHLSSSTGRSEDDELQFHSEAILNDSGHGNDDGSGSGQQDKDGPITTQWTFNPAYDSFDGSNPDGTMRLPQQPPRIIPRGAGYV